MDKYVDYAMGHNAENRMPLWVKPRTKVSPKVVFDCMRDHYEGTPMDMTCLLYTSGRPSDTDILPSVMALPRRKSFTSVVEAG